jgi:hypothetical protein
MSLVEDGRPSSKTSLSTCRKSSYSSRSDTTTIMPDHRTPPITAAQQRVRRSGTPHVGRQGGIATAAVVSRWLVGPRSVMVAACRRPWMVW